MSDRVVLYHGPGCADGFCSAYVCWTVYGAAAEYVEVQYSQPPPDVTGKDVLIVDFSYPRAVLLEMAAKAKSIHVLDHHVSAQRALDGLDFCTFDMNESGATLTWKALRPGEEMPKLVAYVRDRDLWKWELPNSKEISAWVSVEARSFDVWERLATALETDSERQDVVFDGAAILRHIDAYVESTAKNARLYAIAGVAVPVVNAPGMMVSELVDKLAESAAFAVGWHQLSDGRFKYSLRSRGADGLDVSEIAERFGGAGHRAAAGFHHSCPPWILFAPCDHEKGKETP